MTKAHGGASNIGGYVSKNVFSGQRKLVGMAGVKQRAHALALVRKAKKKVAPHKQPA